MVVGDQYNLALVDLKRMKLVAEKRFDIMVRMAITNGRSVVMVPLAEDRVYRLDPSNLEIKQTRFLPGKLKTSSLAHDGRLIVSVESGFGSDQGLLDPSRYAKAGKTLGRGADRPKDRLRKLGGIPPTQQTVFNQSLRR